MRKSLATPKDTPAGRFLPVPFSYPSGVAKEDGNTLLARRRRSGWGSADYDSQLADRLTARVATVA